MKKLLLLALCALIACQAEARTLYVDANRPNNKGNGLSKAKAKKTIQAAINAAKKGDTILVYPGTYAPIKTNNKKISIKSIKGKGKTSLSPSADAALVADLSKHVKISSNSMDYTGNATMLSGFTLDGRNLRRNKFGEEIVLGGTVKFSTAKRFWVYGSDLFWRSKIESCLLQDNYLVMGALVSFCTVVSTKVTGNKRDGDLCEDDYLLAFESTFANCLVARNAFDGCAFSYSTLVNCTVADNTMTYRREDNQFSWGSEFNNCILRNNYSKREDKDQNISEPRKLHNIDPGNVYKNTDKTNKDPKFANTAKGNYKLKKGSYCIDKGKLTKKQKKQVGKTDLAGKKRIKGKAIDRGCYEY